MYRHRCTYAFMLVAFEDDSWYIGCISATPDSQLTTSSIGCLLLKLPPSPCVVLLALYFKTENKVDWQPGKRLKSSYDLGLLLPS